MKADNKPAISLPAYFKSVKKWKYVLRKNKKTKGPKKKKEESPTWRVNVLSVAPRLLIVKAPVKLIRNSFAHENLPVDAVWRRKSYIDEELKDIFQENKHGFDS